ncbi:MAG: hypothetical protein RLZZ546_2163 [Bacteroidota bacterium]|jgi:hypothetical protein
MITTARELNWLSKNKTLTAPDGEALWVCKDCEETECVCDDEPNDYSTSSGVFNGEE